MELVRWNARQALLSAGIPTLALVFFGASSPSRIDDPPPEPANCPLCGGDPLVHAQRTLAYSRIATNLAALTLRW